MGRRLKDRVAGTDCTNRAREAKESLTVKWTNSERCLDSAQHDTKQRKEARPSTTWPLCAKLTADNKFGRRIYFPYVVGGGVTTSLC
jgi:hypothetical protein